MTLRPYQEAALDAVRNRTVPRGIIALPTGTGKGHFAGDLPAALGAQSVLYLAHREELIEQLYRHLRRTYSELHIGIEQGNRTAPAGCPIVIASVPTLAARDGRRLGRMPDDHFDAIIVDEAHHSTASSYMQIWKHFGILEEENTWDGDRSYRTDIIKPDSPPVELIGLTATPGRGDGVGLHNVFDSILYQYHLKDAIRDGWLVPIFAYSVRTSISLDNVKTRGGDFADGELSRAVAVEERNAAVYDAWEKNCKGLKTLVFCVDIAHAKSMAEHFSRHDIDARWVSGTERDNLEWFEQSKSGILCNCQLVTEGIDIPSIEAIVMARPTKSRSLYAQCLGRGTRLARGAYNFDESVHLGKDKCVLLDVTDSSEQLGRQAVNICDIFGTALPERHLGGVDMLEEADRQERDRDAAHDAVVVSTNLAHVDLFGDNDIPTGCALSWLPVPDGLMISMPDNRYVRVQRDTLDRYAIEWREGKEGGWFLSAKTYPTLEQAAGASELAIEQKWPDVMRLVSRRARWRQNEPSEKQRLLCERVGIAIPDGATKGDVSAALDRHFTK